MYVRSSTHLPNLTDELNTAKERRLNQLGTAVLVRCGKRSTDSVELHLGSTHGEPSESDVAPVSLKVELFQLGSAHEKYGV